MAAEISTRSERCEDGATIENLVLRAYANVPHSDHREHLMIDRLRESSGYIPALSILAEMEGKSIGHIMLTKAGIIDARSSVVTLALAPLSVLPEHQSHGVGTLLVEEAQQRASDLGFESIILIGSPSYYTRFGFKPLSSFPITLPFDAPERNRMVRALKPHALDGVSGMVHYAEGWLDH